MPVTVVKICRTFGTGAIIVTNMQRWSAGFLRQLRDIEAKGDIKPDPDVDAYLKASAVEGVRKSPVTQYMIRILGLEVPHCLASGLPPCSTGICIRFSWIGSAVRETVSRDRHLSSCWREWVYACTSLLYR